MKRVRTLLAIASAFALSSHGWAQSLQTDPKACQPGERLQQSETGPKAPAATTGENLSDKLARTEGVICPPETDPDIRLRTPEAGKTPVIPPPGTPGGDQAIRPK